MPSAGEQEEEEKEEEEDEEAAEAAEEAEEAEEEAEAAPTERSKEGRHRQDGEVPEGEGQRGDKARVALLQAERGRRHPLVQHGLRACQAGENLEGATVAGGWAGEGGGYQWCVCVCVRGVCVSARLRDSTEQLVGLAGAAGDDQWRCPVKRCAVPAACHAALPAHAPAP